MKTRYSLPFRASQEVKVSFAPYHLQRNMRNCMDFPLPEGTPIVAARAGKIIHCESRFKKVYSDPFYADRCNRVVILHEDGETSIYAHLKWRSLRVRTGQSVKMGQMLGLSGQTGYATFPHLHFGIYDKNDKNIKIDFE